MAALKRSCWLSMPTKHFINPGDRFGMLTVASVADRATDCTVRWNCTCECGERCVVRHPHLYGGTTRSCGCLMRTVNVVHGDGRSDGRRPEYRIWLSMRERCNNPKCKSYANYGGRGIKVCKRWNSYQLFISDVGPRPTPKHTLDRVDNDGDYCPTNAKWRTRTDQNRNKRSNSLLTVDGSTKTQAEWCEIYGIRQGVLSHRIVRGWDHDRAVKTPTRRLIRKCKS